MPGNSFVNWAKAGNRHNYFVQKILQTDVHVIGTMRSKTEYVMSDKNGKQTVEKLGMKGEQRPDTEYEFTVVFELNQKHQASVSKDRTGLFKNKPELTLNAEVGKTIANWCNTLPPVNRPEVKVQEKEVQPAEIKSDVAELPEVQDGFIEQINACKTVEELGRLFNANPTHQRKYRSYFSQRKNEIELLLNNFLSNGIHN
jgi:hypothetical protein